MYKPADRKPVKGYVRKYTQEVYDTVWGWMNEGKSRDEIRDLLEEKLNICLTPKQVAPLMANTARVFKPFERYDEYRELIRREFKGDGTWIEYSCMRVKAKYKYYEQLFPFAFAEDKRTHERSRRSILVPKHIFNWISAGNELKKGQILFRIDGNYKNDDISNLVVLNSKNIAAKVRALLRGRKEGSYPADYIRAVCEIVNKLYEIKGKVDGQEYV